MILVFIAKRDEEATCKDFLIVGTQVSGSQILRILKEYQVLPWSVCSICCKEVPPWNPRSTF